MPLLAPRCCRDGPAREVGCLIPSEVAPSPLQTRPGDSRGMLEPPATVGELALDDFSLLPSQSLVLFTPMLRAVLHLSWTVATVQNGECPHFLQPI